MAPWLAIAWYVAEWIVRLGALIVVPRQRSPAETRAWLLLLFFQPVPGLLLFLAIGRSRFPEWRRARFRDVLSSLKQMSDGLVAYALDDDDPMLPAAALATKLGYLPAVRGNTVELIDDYDAVIDRLIEDIDAATVSVHLLVYIFANDGVGTRVAEALGRARGRGVDVRVMFDPVGSRPWRRDTSKLLARNDVCVQEALPFRLWRYRTRRDMRNHRKLFVVDERVGYVGSQNIVAKDFRPGIVNRELMARVTGPIVASLATVVRVDWTLEAGGQPSDPVTICEPTGNTAAQLLPSSRDYPVQGFETLLVWQLHRACHRVVIVTPYFIPDEALLSAMRTAALRGVTVDLVLSKVIDQRLVHLAQSSYYDEVLAAGVRIWLFRDYLLHAKNVSVDGAFAVVGSSNVDLRSFQLNEEASLLLYDAASVTAVETIQQGYIDASDRLLPNEWTHRSPARKLLENCARLISSLL